MDGRPIVHALCGCIWGCVADARGRLLRAIHSHPPTAPFFPALLQPVTHIRGGRSCADRLAETLATSGLRRLATDNRPTYPRHPQHYDDYCYLLLSYLLLHMREDTEFLLCGSFPQTETTMAGGSWCLASAQRRRSKTTGVLSGLSSSNSTTPINSARGTTRPSTPRSARSASAPPMRGRSSLTGVSRGEDHHRKPHDLELNSCSAKSGRQGPLRTMNGCMRARSPCIVWLRSWVAHSLSISPSVTCPCCA